MQRAGFPGWSIDQDVPSASACQEQKATFPKSEKAQTLNQALIAVHSNYSDSELSIDGGFPRCSLCRLAKPNQTWWVHLMNIVAEVGYLEELLDVSLRQPLRVQINAVQPT